MPNRRSGFFKTAPRPYGEGDFFLGIQMPVLRKLTKELIDTPLDDAVHPLQSLFHEARMLALLIWVYQATRGDDPLALADILLNDQEDLIPKAVGWMLRAVGDRTAKEAILLPRYNPMSRTMLRYALERVPKPKRQAYLKGPL